MQQPRWNFEQPLTYTPPAVDRFLALLNRHADFWQPNTPIVVGRAPGRLDLMGGIADYSGALVLQLPLDVAALVAVQPDPQPMLTIFSTNARELDAEPLALLPLDALARADQPLSYAAAHALLSADPRRSWAAYVAGVLLVLQRERGLRIDCGLRVLIHSDVPPGKGVSSSAALEVAAMQALCGSFDLPLNGREMAILCQKAENLVVGAPCGVMDQMTAACGEQDRLLALLCQPAELLPSVVLPPEVEVWGIDSGIRHTVSGSDYGSVRVGAFMGYRIIADLAGLTVAPLDDGRVAVDDRRWHGYLANITPSEWETLYRDHVPETLDGAAFLARYGGSTDPVTRIDPQRSYAVRQPTAHPIYEHQRVRLFRSLLECQPTTETLHLLGELMYQSHASYGACGLGSEGTDRLVALVREAGADHGLYGAKITGGGSGGTVAVLARRGAIEAIRRIAAQYERESGRRALLLGGSSSGAVACGTGRVVRG
ncbi:MAG TPA: galactokinase family protein [Herpetosiphonaceae bacterium]